MYELMEQNSIILNTRIVLLVKIKIVNTTDFQEELH